MSKGKSTGLVAFWRDYDRKTYVKAAMLADRLGYDSFWLPEVWGYEVYSLLTEIALKTKRIKIATGITNVYSRSPALIAMQAATLDKVMGGEIQKGDALAVARIAGIQGAKRTSDLIPLCHPIRLDKVRVALDPAGPDVIRVEAEAIAVDRTGVEMEALTAASVAALTVYDMCKAIDKAMQVQDVRLLLKTGGKSGTYEAKP